MAKKDKEGEICMNACAIKPTLPFVNRKTIKKTPASAENRKRVEFMDSHNFSFSVDKETGVYMFKAHQYINTNKMR